MKKTDLDRIFAAAFGTFLFFLVALFMYAVASFILNFGAIPATIIFVTLAFVFYFCYTRLT